MTHPHAGAWWSLLPFIDSGKANASLSPANLVKQKQVTDGTDTAYALARKHGVKTAWGTDVLFQAEFTTEQGSRLAALNRWCSSAEVLRMATSVNAELLAECGPRNPYGRLGVVAEGAVADLLLVDGDPLADLDHVSTPETSLAVILKGGAIVKDTSHP